MLSYTLKSKEQVGIHFKVVIEISNFVQCCEFSDTRPTVRNFNIYPI